MPMQTPEKPAPMMSTSTVTSPNCECCAELAAMGACTFSDRCGDGCVRLEKRGAFAKRLARLGNLVRRQLPGVRNDGPNLQLDADARGPGALGQPRGVIPENFVVADMDEQRRKAGEIGVKGRRKRIARVPI